MPPSGPARASDLLPIRHIPGSVMPNGLRNPWAHYHGETYTPSAHVDAVHGDQRFAGSDSYIGGGNMVGGRAVSLAGDGGGSVIAPSSVSLDGYGEDDGWNGSMGRVHAGHAPDMSSAAGALSQVRPVVRHRRLVEPASNSEQPRQDDTDSGSRVGRQRGCTSILWSTAFIQFHWRPSQVIFSPLSSPRRNSIVGDCPQCHSNGHRRLSNTPVPIGAGSSMRRTKELADDQGLKRNSGRRSRDFK